MTPRFVRFFSAFGLAFGLLAAPAAAAPLSIVATIGMVGDAVKAIAGPRAEVQVLMGEGVDPHLYRQTRSDVVALGRADMIFANGLYLEAQMDELLTTLAEGRPVIRVGETLPPHRLLSHATYHGRYDPHIWMDVGLWADAVTAIREALTAFDPAGEAVYRANAETYLAELARLDADARAMLRSVPAGERVLITAHDAFGYFGRAYGYEVVGIQGLSTESEAGLQDVDTVVRLVAGRKIPAVFVESTVSERNIKAIVEGAAALGHAVTVGGSLYSDAMGAAGTPDGTYVGMIRHNVATIVRALGGSVPAAGLTAPGRGAL